MAKAAKKHTEYSEAEKEDRERVRAQFAQCARDMGFPDELAMFTAQAIDAGLPASAGKMLMKTQGSPAWKPSKPVSWDEVKFNIHLANSECIQGDKNSRFPVEKIVPLPTIVPTGASSTIQPTSAGVWIKEEIERRIATREIREGIRIGQLARLLERWMNDADADKDGYVHIASINKDVRKVHSAHIKASLAEWGCWPINFK
jgi:hypothetical protein